MRRTLKIAEDTAKMHEHLAALRQKKASNLHKKLESANALRRLIPSRWVAAYKSPTRVRTRIVAKDLNRGVSARKLGISSPTPSVDGLHFVLALAARRGWQLKSLDVAHAFMHSPIPKKECIVLQLPQSVSLEDGSLAYLVLYRALNGLCDASLAWLNLLSESIKAVGLFTGPCATSELGKKSI